MRLTVVGECQSSGIKVPIAWMIREVASDHTLYRSVETLGLPISLGMIRSSERVLNVEYLADALKELGRKTSSVICDQFSRRSVVEHPLVNEVSRNFCG